MRAIQHPKKRTGLRHAFIAGLGCPGQFVPRKWRFHNNHALLLSMVFMGSMAFAAGCSPKQRTPLRAELLLPSSQGLAVYRRMVLDNGLRVLLVSNPQAERSAAALSVGVGSLSDPPQSQGLAHFLEHMLFLGSKKYPKPDGYAAFMAQNGGQSNAYTAPDHTNYHFSIPHQAFAQGLDRLAQFFIAPIMDSRYAQREMHAVDSEHGKNLENDSWRTHQVLRTAFLKGHPAATFSTGNLKTLATVKRTTLLAFHQQHYTAERMTLALVSALPLKRLEVVVKRHFAHIRHGGGKPLRFAPQFLEPVPALRELRVRPVANKRALMLYFPLPPVRQDWRARPLQLISFVLGDEGRGSLLSLLKAQGLADSLHAGGGNENTWDYSAFTIYIGLTPKGLAQRFKVAQYVMGAIEGLRKTGIPRRVFHENQQLARAMLKTQKPLVSAREAIRLSRLMQTVPMEALPAQPSLFHAYQPRRIKVLLEHLRTRNMLMLSMGPDLSVEQIEPHYGALYAYQEHRGQRYLALRQAQPDARWHLPLPNPFLPKALGVPKPQGKLQLSYAAWLRLHNPNTSPLLKVLKPHIEQPLTLPQVLQVVTQNTVNTAQDTTMPGGGFAKQLAKVIEAFEPQPVHVWKTPMGHLWQQPPWRVRGSQGALQLRFLTPRAYQTALRAALAQLHAAAVEESMNELGYPMRSAGLDYGVFAVPEGFLVSVSGHAQGLPNVLQTLLQHAKNPRLNKSAFARIKQQQRRTWENQKLSQPYSQALNRRRVLLENPRYPHEMLIAALKPLTLDQVKRYGHTLLQKSYVQGAFSGALGVGDAKAAVVKALALWQAKPLPLAQRTMVRTQPIPPIGTHQVYTERLPVSNSSAVLHMYAGRDTPRLRAVLNLASAALGQRYYTQLRTQQQLGYIVFAGAGRIKNQLHFTFIVQSRSHSADAILAETRQFIPTFLKEIATWNDAEFKKRRQASLKTLLERKQSVEEEARTLFRLAYEYQGAFARKSQSAKALLALSKGDFLAEMQRVFHPEQSAWLALRMLGKDAPPAKDTQATVLHLP